VFFKIIANMKSYSDKLLDPRWQRVKNRIIDAANYRCEDCHRSDLTLHVHHCAYISGLNPWDYDASLLMCVCELCHKERQQQEDAMRVSIGKITRFLSPDRLKTEAWNIIEEMSLRETERLAQSFS
jgi:hypothetical protein